jgi:predicted glycosyltransferase
MLARAGLEAVTVGRHGGAGLKEKLLASTRRIERLITVIDEAGPDLCISFSSPEAARSAFGLGIPHLCVSDSPHAESVSRLTVPFSRVLFTPSAIPVNAWTKYGILRRRIVRYDALDPVVWLRDFKPNPRVLGELRLDPERRIVVLRPEEAQSAYLHGVALARGLIASVSNALARRFRDLQVVLLPRYNDAEALRKRASERVVVPRDVVDSASLLSYSALFVGAGGTMTAEAALLGVPSISCYPSEPTYVDKYLLRHGLLMRATAIGSIIEKSVEMLEGGEQRERRARARTLLESMEDPLLHIERQIDQMV